MHNHPLPSIHAHGRVNPGVLTMQNQLAGEGIPRASLVPGMLPDELLPELWRQSVAPFHDAIPIERRDGSTPMLPSIHQYHLGQALFMDTTFPAQRFRRDAAWMARHDDIDYVLLQHFVEGINTVANGEHVYTEQPGNIYAVNMNRPIDAASSDADVVVLALPRQLLLNELPHLADACGAIFDPETAAARIFCDHLASLRQHIGAMSASDAPGIMQGTVGLLDALVKHGDITSSVSHSASLGAVCRYIDAHLQDPDLDAATLCAQFRCSRATLYRLFQPLGGVREHIQRRRLAACFKLISAPTQAHRKIFDIAMDYGFVSQSHFSGLFRSHFGMTPREVRDLAVRPSLMPVLPAEGRAEDMIATMQRWAQDLATGKR